MAIYVKTKALRFLENKNYTVLSSKSSLKKEVIEMLQGEIPGVFSKNLKIKKDDLFLLVSTVSFDEKLFTNSLEEELKLIKKNLRFYRRTVPLKEYEPFISINLFQKNKKNYFHLEKIMVLLTIASFHRPKYIALNNILGKVYDKDLKCIKNYINYLHEKFSISFILFSDNLKDLLNGEVYFFKDKSFSIMNMKKALKNDNLFLKEGIKIDPMTRISILLENYEVSSKMYDNPTELVEDLW